MVGVDLHGHSGNSEKSTVAAIAAAVSASNFERAYQLSNRAINIGLCNRITYNARALALQSAGRHREAISDFREALRYSPNDPNIYNAIGVSELSLMEFDAALKSFSAAIQIDPRNALSHYRRGLTLGRSGDHEAARASYEKAIDLQPDFPLALASLASIFARKRRHAEATDYADRALALDPTDSTALLALTIVDMNNGHYESAERRLKSLLPTISPSSDMRNGMLAMLGDALDGQHRYAEAFATYKTNNDEIKRANHAQYKHSRGVDALRYITTYFKHADPSAWLAPEASPSPQGPREHVFLLGFMRSGTTLLEQVLASNASVVAFEERSLLKDLGDRFLTGDDRLDDLRDLKGEDLENARHSYWKKALSYGEDLEGKVFVDKQPLDTPKLPLITKLFPHAKIIFAVRDPRDVVFSCFRRNFRVHVVGYEFLTLEDTASFYSAVMDLAELYQQKLALNILRHRYEDMVSDFETSVRNVCRFIGLEWSDSMREFDKNAPKVDLRSPSARQVQRPLYGEGIGQWRNYAHQMASVLPILEPWVTKFGYSAE